MTYLDLLQKASAKAKEARAIIDVALDGHRELTEYEMSRVKSLGAESDMLREQGEAMQAAEKRTEYFAQPMNEAIKPDPSGGYTRPHLPGELRMLRHGERLNGSNKPGELSIGRLIRGMATGKWDGAEPERRTMSTLSAGAGGILVPETLSLDLIDLFRAESVLEAAGMGILPMPTQDVTLPVIASDPTAAWVGENQDFSESEGTLDYCKLTALKLGVLTKVSLELVEDSPMAAQVIENLLAVAIAQEVDNAALFGSGVGEPVGITKDTRIEKIDLGANGAAITDYSKLLQAVQILLENNVPTGPGEISVIMSPREWATIAAFHESAGPYYEPPRWLSEKVTFRVASKLPVNLTKGTSDDASQILVGRFSEMALGIRTQVNIEATRVGGDSGSSAFKKGQVWVRAYMRCDVAIRRPSAFVLIDGIIPA